MRSMAWGVGFGLVGIAAMLVWVMQETPAERLPSEVAAPVVIAATSVRPEPDGFVARRDSTKPVRVPEAIDLAPEPTATLVGRIVLPDGEPAHDALVNVRYLAPVVTWIEPPRQPRRSGRRGLAAPPAEPTPDPRAEFEAAFERALVRVSRAGRDGSFRFDDLRAPASVTVEIEAPPGSNALPTRLESVALRGDATTTLPDVHLVAGARIDGQVVDEWSNAMVHARVRTHDGRVATTDAAGRFVFDGLPDGTFDLSTTHQDGFDALANGVRVRAMPGRSEFVRIELPRAAHVAGRVIDQDGLAVARADVLVEFETIDGDGIVIRGVGATTDAAGAFDVGGIRRNAECRVSVHRAGYTTPRAQAPASKSASTGAPSYVWTTAGERNLELALFRLPRATIECVDAITKRPLVPASIAVGAVTHASATIEEFRIGPGLYEVPLESTAVVQSSVGVSIAGFDPKSVTATLGPRDLDLGRLEFSPIAGAGEIPVDVTPVEGRVIDALTQSAIAGAVVDVLGLDQTAGTDLHTRTDDDGRFRLVLRTTDVRDLSDTLRVRAGARRYAPEIVLLRDVGLIPMWPRSSKREHGAVTGGVIGRDGRPAVGLHLVCDGRSTLTDERGLFALTRLDFTPVDELVARQPAKSIEPAITNRLRVLLGGMDPLVNGTPFPWRFDVSEPAPEATVTIDLRPYTGSLRGRVRINGSIVPGLRIELIEPIAPMKFQRFLEDAALDAPTRILTATTTRQDGSYEFPLLVPLEGALRVVRNGRPLGEPTRVRIGAADDATADVFVATADVRGRVVGFAPGGDLPIVTARRAQSRGVQQAPIVQSVMTRTDGSFELLDLLAGTYTFTARTMDHATAPQIVDVMQNGSESVELELIRVHRVVLDPETWNDVYGAVPRLSNAEGITVTPATERDLHDRVYFAEVSNGAYELLWEDARNRKKPRDGTGDRRAITVDGEARDIVVKAKP